MIAVVGVVIAAALFFAAALLTSGGDTKVRLGDDEFKVGKVDALATRVERDGPLLFQDLLIGGTRDIYVNHLGSDNDLGWVAFEARVPGSPRECTLVWNAGADVFTDPCTKATVPADGDDLPHYPTRVTRRRARHRPLTGRAARARPVDHVDIDDHPRDRTPHHHDRGLKGRLRCARRRGGAVRSSAPSWCRCAGARRR